MVPTLTTAQLSQLEAAADGARAETIARFHAGESDITVERRNKLIEGQPPGAPAANPPRPGA